MEMLRGLGMDPSAETSWAPEIPTLTPTLMTLFLIHKHILSKLHTPTPPHTLSHSYLHTLSPTHSYIHTYTFTFIHMHIL